VKEPTPEQVQKFWRYMMAVFKASTVDKRNSFEMKALSALLGSLKLTITDTEGFAAAFVTRGGVKLKEVNPKTLESRMLPGLYIAGELLNLDGPTGGFNLQWAFSSGWLAGKSVS